MSDEPDRIAAPTHVTDHVAAGLALLPEQFRDKPSLTALAAAWLAQVQDAEDALWDLVTQAALDAAVGAQLDQLGVLLAFGRGALDDATYRAVLRAAVRARRARGTPDDVAAVAQLALGAATFTYLEGDASVVVAPDAPLGFDPTALLAVLRLATPAGVQLELVYAPRAAAATFAFGTDPLLPVTDAARGLADVAGTTGGYLAGVLA